MEILLLGGKSGSGKTYIAKILEQRGWFHLAFADALKDIVAEKYSIDRCDLDTQEGKKKIYTDGMTYRDILITESKQMKKQDINIFCKIVSSKIKSQPKVVISDMRYPHEYEYISNTFTEAVVKSCLVKRNQFNEIDDPSETSMDDFKFDICVDNNKEGGEAINFLLKTPLRLC